MVILLFSTDEHDEGGQSRIGTGGAGIKYLYSSQGSIDASVHYVRLLSSLVASQGEREGERRESKKEKR